MSEQASNSLHAEWSNLDSALDDLIETGETVAKKTKVSLDLDHFACPVCLDVPRDAIFMCGNGHNICPDCHHRLNGSPKTCPECREPYDHKIRRNLTLQKMIADLTEIELKCRFTKWGCAKSAKRRELVEHEKECPLSACFPCPLPQCTETVSTITFHSHCLTEKHRNDICNLGVIDANTLRFSLPVDDTTSKYAPSVWLWNNVPLIGFLEFIPKKNGRSYYWVAVAGGESEAQKYSCEIALVNENIEPVYKYRGPIHSIDKRLDFVRKSCLGLPLTSDVMFRYQQGELDEQDDTPRLHFNVTINKTC